MVSSATSSKRGCCNFLLLTISISREKSSPWLLEIQISLLESFSFLNICMYLICLLLYSCAINTFDFISLPDYAVSKQCLKVRASPRKWFTFLKCSSASCKNSLDWILTSSTEISFYFCCSRLRSLIDTWFCLLTWPCLSSSCKRCSICSFWSINVAI